MNGNVNQDCLNNYGSGPIARKLPVGSGPIAGTVNARIRPEGAGSHPQHKTKGQSLTFLN